MILLFPYFCIQIVFDLLLLLLLFKKALTLSLHFYIHNLCLEPAFDTCCNNVVGVTLNEKVPNSGETLVDVGLSKVMFH